MNVAISIFLALFGTLSVIFVTQFSIGNPEDIQATVSENPFQVLFPKFVAGLIVSTFFMILITLNWKLFKEPVMINSKNRFIFFAIAAYFATLAALSSTYFVLDVILYPVKP